MSRRGCFTHEGKLDTRRTGRFVGLGEGLENLEKEKLVPFPGTEERVLSCQARSVTLPTTMHTFLP